MADDYWRNILAIVFQDFVDVMEKTRSFGMDTAFPSLVKKSTPDERMAYYEGELQQLTFADPNTGQTLVGWDALKLLAPDLWKAFTQDALSIQRARNKEMGVVEPIPFRGMMPYTPMPGLI